MGSRYKKIFKFLMDNNRYSKVHIKAYELLYNMSRFGVWFFQGFFSEKTLMENSFLESVIVGQESVCPFGSFLQVLSTYVVIQI